jgi:cytochrome b
MRKAAIEVWDPLVRLGHWLLVAAVLTAWLTRKGGGRWHEWVGYASLAIVVVRLIWGRWGTSTARFASFVRSPIVTLHYARAVVTGQEPRYLGHNPLGAWMIVALLADVVLVAASGWLYTTDRFWGVEWVEELHSALADMLLWLIALHVTGVLYASLHHRENLIAAMLHGRKRTGDGGNGLRGD